MQTFTPLALVAKTGRSMWEVTDEGDDALAFDDGNPGLRGRASAFGGEISPLG